MQARLQRRRRPPDQQHRRRHQLRAARARPADARVRPGAARRRPDPRADGARTARRSGRSTARLRTLDADMLVIADAAAAGRGRRRHGRRRLRGDRRHDDDRPRERVLQPAVGAAHEQEARPEDRGQHALRARRRSAAAGDGDGARVRAARADRRRDGRAAPSSTAIPRASSRACCGCGGARSAGCSASPCRTPTSRRILESLGFALRDVERRLGRHRADASRGRAARSGPDRGGRAALRLRSHPGDVSRAASAPPPIDPRIVARPPAARAS